MILGLDYDGTIANTNLMKSRWIRDNLGLDVPPWKTDRTSCIPALAEHMSLEIAKKVYNGFKEFIYTGEYAKATPEIPGAIEGIKQLAKNNKLWMITARPAERVQDSLEWLAARSVLDCFNGWYSSGSEDKQLGRILSKQEICETYNFDVIVDDDARHLNEIKLPGLKRILIKNGSNEYTGSGGIYITTNWKDVVKVITSI